MGFCNVFTKRPAELSIKRPAGLTTTQPTRLYPTLSTTQPTMISPTLSATQPTMISPTLSTTQPTRLSPTQPTKLSTTPSTTQPTRRPFTLVKCLIAAFVMALFIFSILGSISLPRIPALDIVSVKFNNPPPRGVQQTNIAKQLRIYVWGFCSENALSGNLTCSSPGLGYHLDVKSLTNDVHIASSLTRALGVHLAATIAMFILTVYIIFCLSYDKDPGEHRKFFVVVVVVALLCTITALVVDIAVTVTVEKKIKQLGLDTKSRIGFGFGATILYAILAIPISILLLYLQGKSRRVPAFAGARWVESRGSPEAVSSLYG